VTFFTTARPTYRLQRGNRAHFIIDTLLAPFIAKVSSLRGLAWAPDNTPNGASSSSHRSARCLARQQNLRF